MTFSEATTVTAEPGGEGAATTMFHAHVAEGWDVAGNANGGYLLSIAARAITEATGRPDVLTTTGHFLRPGAAGDTQIRVRTIRSGRRHATAAATLGPADAPVLEVLATTTDLVAVEGLDRVDGTPPELPDPADCRPLEPSDTFPPPFMGRVEVRLHPDDSGFGVGQRSGEPAVRGWFRHRGGESLTSHSLVLASDAFPPTLFNTDAPVRWVPTVELTTHIRARPSGDPDEWLRCRFTTRFITGGYLEEDGEIWSADGSILAQSRQLALVAR